MNLKARNYSYSSRILRSIIIHVLWRMCTRVKPEEYQTEHSSAFIHDRNFPYTFPPHTNLVTYVHTSDRDRDATTASTNYQRAPPGGSRWILSLSIYARDVRCRFRSYGWNCARKKRKLRAQWRGKGGAEQKEGRNGSREKKRFVEGIDATKHRSGFDESN